MKTLFTEKEAAEYIGYSIHSLRKSRQTNMLAGIAPPAFTRIGTRTIRYKKHDLDQWVADL